MQSSRMEDSCFPLAVVSGEYRNAVLYQLINDEGEFVQRYYHVPKDWLATDHENLLVVFDELGGSVASVQLVSSTMVPDGAAALEMTDGSSVAVVARE
jgi:hypothetical protein